MSKKVRMFEAVEPPEEKARLHKIYQEIYSKVDSLWYSSDDSEIHFYIEDDVLKIVEPTQPVKSFFHSIRCYAFTTQVTRYVLENIQNTSVQTGVHFSVRRLQAPPQFIVCLSKQ